MSLSSLVKVVIGGDARGALKAFHDVEGAAKGHSSTLAKFGLLAGGTFAAVGTAALAFGVSAVKAGDQLNESQDKLRKAVENTGGSWDKQKKALEDAAKASAKYGESESEVLDALREGTVATGSSTKALQLLKTAQNLTAETGKPLAVTMIAVAKASEGNLRPLKQLGIDLPIAAGGALQVKKAQDKLAAALITLNKLQNSAAISEKDKLKRAAALVKANNAVADAQDNLDRVQHAGTDIITELNKRTKGMADEGASSLAGKTAALRANFENLRAHIGQALIPILAKLTGWIVDDVIPALGKAATWVRTVMIPALIAFGEGVVSLYNKYVAPIVADIVKLFLGMKNEIQGILQLISDLFHGHWSHIWDDVKQILGGIVQTVKAELSGLIDSAGRIMVALAQALGRGALAAGASIMHNIVSGITGTVGGIANIGKAIYDAFARFVNDNLIDPIRNFSVSFFGSHYHPFGSLPELPILHSGGIYNNSSGEGLALLQSGEGVFTQGQMRALGGMIRGGGGNQYVTVYGANDPRTIQRLQQKWNRRNGIVDVTTP